jgi:hypothetical protein
MQQYFCQISTFSSLTQKFDKPPQVLLKIFLKNRCLPKKGMSWENKTHQCSLYYLAFQAQQLHQTSPDKAAPELRMGPLPPISGQSPPPVPLTRRHRQQLPLLFAPWCLTVGRILGLYRRSHQNWWRGVTASDQKFWLCVPSLTKALIKISPDGRWIRWAAVARPPYRRFTPQHLNIDVFFCVSHYQ